MIRGKTRHQLFLPDELSRRLTAMAKSQKRARSDLLLEMVEAYLTRRAATDTDSLARQLSRMTRTIEDNRRETFFISHSFQQFLRLYLIYTAMHPVPRKDAIAQGEKVYRSIINDVTRMLATGPKDISTAEDKS